ncbi:MAG TPA: SIMPL domain-containing protein [Clostridia bacterium]|nr:SIMPL domain-containing protein [Clostridia bacterium]
MEEKSNSLFARVRENKFVLGAAVTLAIVAVFWLGVGLNVTGEAAAAGEAGTNIAVMGSGDVMVDPDRARLTIGSVAQGKTAKSVQESVAKTQNEVIKLLGEQGIPKEKIQTSQYSIYPEYDNNSKITGYRANYDLEVIVDDLDKIGPIIDASVGVGSNRLNGVRFERTDKSEAYNEALANAVNDAMQKAEAIAAALGKNVVRVVQVEEQGASVEPMFRQNIAFDSVKSMAETSIEPGQLQVMGRINVVVEVK